MNFYSHNVLYQTQQKLLNQMETDKHVMGTNDADKVDKQPQGNINYSYNRNMAKVVEFNHKMLAKLARKRQKASVSHQEETSSHTYAFSDISLIFLRRTKLALVGLASTKLTKRTKK